ncbi:hypothetical protein LTR08_007918 [Meristemomyces frigidus]|nr:hypothetical protein LTR08_007918 [Meristemomyces frigidus]
MESPSYSSPILKARHARYADHIVAIARDGRIIQEGSYEQLHKSNPDLSKLLVQAPMVINKETDSSETGPISKTRRSVENSIDLTRRSGDLSIYAYMLRSAGWPYCTLFFATVMLYALSATLQVVLLQHWSAAETSNPGAYTNIYLGLYGMLAGLSVVGLLSLLANMLLFAGPRMSIRLHEILLKSTMGAPLCWFTSTDSGTTLNRFSQDMSLIDMDLLVSLIDTAAGFTMATTEAVLIVLGAKWAALALPVIFGTVYLLQNIYLRTSRQLRYLDLEAKAPLYSHFLETLSGLTTIRAFNWRIQMAAKNQELLDMSQRPFYLLYCVQRWLRLVLDLIVAGIAVVLVTLATQVRSTTSPSALGVALVNVLNFSITLGFLVEKWTALETSIGAVARVKGFECDVISENGPGEESDTPAEWPSAGELDIDNVSVVYGPDTPPVLHEISIRVPAGQRVGIVGRTGSGKSSLLLTLLRLTNLNAGAITIDGVALTGLRRSAVCRALISIPQEPCLLPGTVRFNADPFCVLSDAAITAALDMVGLVTIMQASGGLSADMISVKLSRGQQQLFGVAQALCRKEALGGWNHGVLLLDEVTSDVDSETEQIILGVLAEGFRGWTVLSVAHRPEALAGYDRVIVLDQGRIVEDGEPRELR